MLFLRICGRCTHSKGIQEYWRLRGVSMACVSSYPMSSTADEIIDFYAKLMLYDPGQIIEGAYLGLDNHFTSTANLYPFFILLGAQGICVSDCNYGYSNDQGWPARLGWRRVFLLDALRDFRTRCRQDNVNGSRRRVCHRRRNCLPLRLECDCCSGNSAPCRLPEACWNFFFQTLSNTSQVDWINYRQRCVVRIGPSCYCWSADVPNLTFVPNIVHLKQRSPQ